MLCCFAYSSLYRFGSCSFFRFAAVFLCVLLQCLSHKNWYAKMGSARLLFSVSFL